MNPWNRPAATVETQARAVDQGLRSYMLKVYNYMASGVLLTGIVAYLAAHSPAFLGLVFGTDANGGAHMTPLGWMLTFAPVVMVLVLSARAYKMSLASLQMSFWGYAGLMGLSLFSIFLVYTGASIAQVFFVTAGTFGLMSMYGYATKRDLTSWGSFLFIGIWAMFIAGIVNVFVLHSGMFNLLMSVIGVGLALGLTAFQTQKLKDVYYRTSGNGELQQRTAVLGALQLYFDFIYLFINLLQLTGSRR